MFRYRLYTPDGDEIGEAAYAMMIQPGEEVLFDGVAAMQSREVVEA